MGKIIESYKATITETYNKNDTKERSPKDELFAVMAISNVCGDCPIIEKEFDYKNWEATKNSTRESILFDIMSHMPNNTSYVDVVVRSLKDGYRARYFKEPDDLRLFLKGRKIKLLLDGTYKPTGELEYFKYDAKNKLYYVNHEKVIKVFAKLLNEIELTYSDLFQNEKEIIKDYFFYKSTEWYDKYLLITPERYLIRLAKFGKEINYEDAEFKKGWNYEKGLYAPKYAQKNKFKLLWKEKFLVRDFLKEYFDFDLPDMYDCSVHECWGVGPETAKSMNKFENIDFTRCILNENKDW